MAAMEVAGIGMIFGFMSLVSDPERIQRQPLLQNVYDNVSRDSINSFLVMVGIYLV